MSHAHHGSHSTQEHRHESESIGAVKCAVLVISDSRTERTDRSGRTAERLITDGGHEIVHRDLVVNDAGLIRGAIEASLAAGAQFVFCTGGTGLGDRDITVDTVTPLLDKVLDGYGEWFRQGQLGPDWTRGHLVARRGGQAGTGIDRLLTGLHGSRRARAGRAARAGATALHPRGFALAEIFSK